jgi:hypothetical protein
MNLWLVSCDEVLDKVERKVVLANCYCKPGLYNFTGR